MTAKPTPRTDAMVTAVKGWAESARARNLAYLCRKLERELSKTEPDASSAVTGKQCGCELCYLSKQLQRLAAKCTPLEKAALDRVWTRMEGAETDLDWLKAEAQEGKPVVIEGRKYVPQPKRKP